MSVRAPSSGFRLITPMRILLPPSEGKTPPHQGVPLVWDSLSFPELTAERHRIATALVKLARGPAARAQQVLGLSARQSEELLRDAALLTEPTAPASTVYTGVLFDALGLPTLSTNAARRARSSVLISSALFGIVRPHDAIPAYRLSGDVDLPGIGPVTTIWRTSLPGRLEHELVRGLVLDLRSGVYAAHFPLRGAITSRSASIRVLQETRNGREVKRTIVSHHNKATKGHLARALLESGSTARTVDSLVDDLRDLGFVVETPQQSGDGPRVLDVIV